MRRGGVLLHCSQLMVSVGGSKERVAYGVTAGARITIGNDLGIGDGSNRNDQSFGADLCRGIVDSRVDLMDDVRGLQFGFSDHAGDESGCGINKELAMIRSSGFVVMPIRVGLKVSCDATTTTAIAASAKRGRGCSGVKRCDASLLDGREATDI